MPFDGAAIADVLETVIRAALLPVQTRLKALEQGLVTPDTIGALRERLATLEARPELAKGADGEPGQPGPDGLGFDDYQVEFDGERTFRHVWTRGDRTVEKSFRVPAAIYRGVYVEGRIYERGDLVTVSGSVYHCNADTVGRPAPGSTDWTLAVKQGRDLRAR